MYDGVRTSRMLTLRRRISQAFLMRDLFLTYQTSGRFSGAGAVLRLRADRMGRRLLGPIGVTHRKRAP